MIHTKEQTLINSIKDKFEGEDIQTQYKKGLAFLKKQTKYTDTSKNHLKTF